MTRPRRRERHEDITGVFQTELEAATKRQHEAGKHVRRLVEPGGRTVLVVDGDRNRACEAGDALVSHGEYERFLVALGVEDAVRMLKRRSDLRIEGLAIEDTLSRDLLAQLGQEWKDKITIYGSGNGGGE
jgi:hypothetical protein